MNKIFKMIEDNFDEGLVYVGMKKKDNQPFSYFLVDIKKAINTDFTKQMMKGDLYFTTTPMKLGSKSRSKDNAMDSNVLFLDNDKGVDGIESTFKVESSTGNFHEYIIVDEKMDMDTRERFQKALAKKYGYDSASTDGIHLSRIPNTFNHKPQNNCRVSDVIVSNDPKIYSVEELEELVKGVEVSESTTYTYEDLDVAESDYDDLYSIYKLHDVMNKEFEGRSEKVYAVLSTMFKNGASKEEALSFMLQSEFAEKYNNIRSWKQEVQRVYAKVMGNKIVEATKPKFEVKKFGDIVPKQEEPWLIEGLWRTGNVGLVAGSSKSRKSLTTLKAAIAISKGESFMGRKTTKTNVMIIQLENTESMEWRRAKEFGADENTNLFYVDGTNFTVDDVLDLKDSIVENEIGLLIIDPLYMAKGTADLNDSADMTRILTKITKLRNQTDCAVMLIHHSRKLQHDMEIEASDIFGSQFLFAWLENLWLMQLDKADVNNSILKVSGRSIMPEKFKINTLGEWNFVGEEELIENKTDLNDVIEEEVVEIDNSTENKNEVLPEQSETSEVQPSDKLSGNFRFYDLEVYNNNYFGVVKDELGNSKVFFKDDDIASELNGHTTFSYNGNGYDDYVVNNWGISPKAMKKFNDELIAGNVNTYQLKKFSVDLFTLLGGMGSAPSLKELDFQINGEFKETPIPFDRDLSDEELKLAIDYCTHDVDVTKQVFDMVQDDIAVQSYLAENYNFDHTRSNPQNLAEMFNTKQLTLADTLATQEDIDEANKWLEEHPELKGGKVTYGKGGVHYSAGKGTYDNVYETDVTSYYPSIMLNFNLLGNKTPLLREIYDERVKAKKSGDLIKSDALKLVINSLYGVINSKFFTKGGSTSIGEFVTQYGQATLAKLAFALEKAGATIVQCNTDAVAWQSDEPERMKKIISKWEEKFNFGMETELYEKVIQKDVNGYTALVNGEWIVRGGDLGNAKGRRVLKKNKFPVLDKLLFKALTGEEVDIVPMDYQRLVRPTAIYPIIRKNGETFREAVVMKVGDEVSKMKEDGSVSIVDMSGRSIEELLESKLDNWLPKQNLIDHIEINGEVVEDLFEQECLMKNLSQNKMDELIDKPEKLEEYIKGKVLKDFRETTEIKVVAIK